MSGIWETPEQQHWVTNDGDYQTQIFYTDDPPDPDAEHPTEWVILRKSDGEQVASGWGQSPRRAREMVLAEIAKLRTEQTDV